MVDMGYQFRIYEPGAAAADRTHVRLHAMGVEHFLNKRQVNTRRPANGAFR